MGFSKRNALNLLVKVSFSFNMSDKQTQLLNLLYSCDEDIFIQELWQWINAKTDGKYVLIENSNIKPLNPLDEIKHK